MVLFWRGWGISVLYLFVFWFVAALAFVVVAMPHQPDALQAAMDAQWLFAAMFALHAASVFALSRYRRSHPGHVIDPQIQAAVAVPHTDEFMFLRFDVWPYILLAIAAVIACATLLRYPLFGG